MKEKIISLFAVCIWAVILLILSPLIIVIALFFGTLHVLNTPKRRRERKLLTELVLNTARSGKRGYLWYDRNAKIADFIENEIIPIYGRSLIIEYGDQTLGKVSAEKYKEITRLAREYAELGELDDRGNLCNFPNENNSVEFYAFGKNGALKKWCDVWSETTDRMSLVRTRSLLAKVVQNPDIGMTISQKIDLQAEKAGDAAAAKVDKFFGVDSAKNQPPSFREAYLRFVRFRHISLFVLSLLSTVIFIWTGKNDLVYSKLFIIFSVFLCGLFLIINVFRRNSKAFWVVRATIAYIFSVLALILLLNADKNYVIWALVVFIVFEIAECAFNDIRSNKVQL